MAVRTKETEPLADLWRRQFIEELDRKIASTISAAEATQPNGWFRGQLEEAISMYRAARKAVSSLESSVVRPVIGVDP